MGGGKGGGSSSGGSSSTTQKTEPWDAQKPYLTQIFEAAAKLRDQGQLAPDYYPGSVLAPMSEPTQEALEKQHYRATHGNDGMRAAQDQLKLTMEGQYLDHNPFIMGQNQNPYLDSMVERAIGQTNAGVAGNAAAAGRYGSGAFNAAANDAAGNIATQMYGQAYDNDMNRALSAWNNERNNQIKGMMFAPQLAAADYQDLAALAEVGTAQENYHQQQINEDINRYNYGENQDAIALQNYANLIQGYYGSNSSASTSGSGRSNPLGSVASGALAGGGLASLLGASNPWVAGAAGIGGLLGLF